MKPMPLTKLVRACLNVETREDYIYAFAETILYIAGASTAFEYQKFVKPFCEKQSAKVFRLKLLNGRYTNLDLKLFTLKLASLPLASRGKEIEQLRVEYGVAKSDARLISILLAENSWFKTSIGKVVKSVGKKNPFFDLANINKLFEGIYPHVTAYIKALTYKKMRFLVKHDNQDFEGLHSDLMSKVLQSFYSMLPTTKSALHIVNYLKRAAHNHAINMIKSHTSQKRGRLVNVGVDKNDQAQFTLLCVSQNQAALTTEGEESDALNVADDSNRKFETRFSISQLLESVSTKSKKYRFLSLLLGVEDAEFTAWLHTEHLCRASEDNVAVQDRTTAADFNRYVADFLNVSYRKVESFLDSLKTMVFA